MKWVVQFTKQEIFLIIHGRKKSCYYVISQCFLGSTKVNLEKNFEVLCANNIFSK